VPDEHFKSHMVVQRYYSGDVKNVHLIFKQIYSGNQISSESPSFVEYITENTVISFPPHTVDMFINISCIHRF